MRIAVFAIAAVFATAAARGQRCPEGNRSGATSPSEARTLEGNLVFHDAIRKWFELKLDAPQCGQNSIELAALDDERSLQVLRGCRVRSRDVIGFSPTGYYSLDMYQDVEEIESIGTCEPQLPFPDYSDAKPGETVRQYRVDMQVNYGPGDYPIVFRISRGGKELQPWRAYANYILTGGFVLYGQCGKGFVVDKVFGTPQAKPSHFEEPRTPYDMAVFDPESAAASGITDLHLGYTCVREP